MYTLDAALDQTLGTVSNMLITFISQDWRSGNDSWRHPYVDDVFDVYDFGRQDLANPVRLLSSPSIDNL